ncbi:MAG TPA: CPXCG motif-containing cysteine-rich protein [Bacteroidota bacterium]
MAPEANVPRPFVIIFKTLKRKATAGCVQRLAVFQSEGYLPPMEIECTFVCAYCLQVNTVMVDGSAERHQEYIEDCQVCCRPNRLTIDVDRFVESAEIDAEPA